MKRLCCSLFMYAVFVAATMLILFSSAKAETVMFPVIALSSATNEESSASGFATVTLDATRDASGSISAASARIMINFYGFPENAYLLGMSVVEGSPVGPQRIFREFSVEIGSVRTLDWSGLTVTPDAATRIINNPANFYLVVSSLRNTPALSGQLGSTAKITTVIRTGKKLFILGENFAPGAEILINGEPQKTVNDEGTAPGNSPAKLIGKKAGKKIAPGQTVLIQVREPNGWLSNEFIYTRPVE